MNQQPVSRRLSHRKAFLFTLLLMGFFLSKASHPGDTKKTFGTFVNGKRLESSTDSLAINANGILTLHLLAGESPKAEKVRFKALIRHRNFIGRNLLFTWDETLNEGKPVNAVDLSKILKRTKAGDQLIVIPLDNESNGENTPEYFQIKVPGDNC